MSWTFLFCVCKFFIISCSIKSLYKCFLSWTHLTLSSRKHLPILGAEWIMKSSITGSGPLCHPQFIQQRSLTDAGTLLQSLQQEVQSWLTAALLMNSTRHIPEVPLHAACSLLPASPGREWHRHCRNQLPVQNPGYFPRLGSTAPLGAWGERFYSANLLERCFSRVLSPKSILLFLAWLLFKLTAGNFVLQ